MSLRKAISRTYHILFVWRPWRNWSFRLDIFTAQSENNNKHCWWRNGSWRKLCRYKNCLFPCSNSFSDLRNHLEVLSKNPKWNNKLYHLIIPIQPIRSQQIEFLLKTYEIYTAIILKQKDYIALFTTYPHKWRKRLNYTHLCSTDFKFLNSMSKRIVGECSFKMIWSGYPGLTKNPYARENPGLMVRLLNTVTNIMNCTADYAKEANSLVVKEHTERKNWRNWRSMW